MKFTKLSLTLIALSLLLFTAYSCKDNKQKNPEKMEESKQGKEYTSDYICPMHCEGSGSDKPGTCPVCGMDYKPNEDHKSDGHDHSGHNH